MIVVFIRCDMATHLPGYAHCSSDYAKRQSQNVCLSVCLSACLPACLSVCLSVSVFMYLGMYVCIYVCMYVCVYVRICSPCPTCVEGKGRFWRGCQS